MTSINKRDIKTHSPFVIRFPHKYGLKFNFRPSKVSDVITERPLKRSDSFSYCLSMSLPINVPDLCEGRFDNIDDKYHECTQTIHVIDGRVCVVCRPTSSSNKIIAPPDHRNHMVDEILIKSVCICAVALEKN